MTLHFVLLVFQELHIKCISTVHEDRYEKEMSTGSMIKLSSFV